MRTRGLKQISFASLVPVVLIAVFFLLLAPQIAYAGTTTETDGQNGKAGVSTLVTTPTDPPAASEGDLEGNGKDPENKALESPNDKNASSGTHDPDDPKDPNGVEEDEELDGKVEKPSEQTDLQGEANGQQPPSNTVTPAPQTPAAPAPALSERPAAEPKAATISEQSTATAKAPAIVEQSTFTPKAGLTFQVHVQNIGDQGWRSAGVGPGSKGMAGTTGRSLRMESLQFKLTGNLSGSVQYQVHVQNIGWQTARADGQRAGTTGRSLRLEGLSLALVGDVSRYYDVYYRVHVQNDGWQGWRHNGQYAGTTGRSLRLEAIEVYLQAKSPSAASADGIVGVVYQGHVQNVGWQDVKNTGGTAGTSGQSLRVEALKIWLNKGKYGGGIEYNAHIQNIGWQGWRGNGTAAGTTGRSLRMEALQVRLTGNISNYYDIEYRAHVQNIGWQPWVVNGGMVGTTGRSLRMEAIQIRLVKKGPATLSDGGYIVTTASNPGFALDDPGASESANVQMQVYGRNNGTYAQRFYVQNVGSGYVTIQSVASALYLTDSAGTVRQQKHTGAQDQKWRLYRDGGLNVINVGTGRSFALAAASPRNGTKVNAATQNHADQKQHWLFENVGIIPDGTYSFANVPTNRRLDVWNAQLTNGGDVRLGNANSGNNQKFTVTYLGNNQYSIRNVMTKRAVQVSGTNVNMWTYKGSNAQKWRAQLTGPKTFKFVNVGNGQAMDTAGTANGSNIRTAKSSGAASQNFKLVGTSRIAQLVNIGVSAIMQNPELPTGCESVALTEALKYYGFRLSKTTIADRYMPYGNDGVYDFIGNPYDWSGWIICAPGITNTANSFISRNGGGVSARNITGTSLGGLREYLDRGQPVIVWTTMYMGDPGGVQMWQHGYPLRSNNHAVVLSGYNPGNNTYLVADPLSGSVWRNGGRFESLYNAMGKQAVVLEN